jgi:hypothetical protein
VDVQVVLSDRRRAQEEQMNYRQLVNRAFQITWRHKVLWIFGILLAMTSGGGGGGGSGGGGGNGASMPSFPSRAPALGAAEWQLIAGLLLLCCCVFLVLIVVGTIVHYVARGALYRSVDQIEETGAAPTWREGFRLGWSKRSLRMWLLDLIVGIPFFIAAILLLLIGASPLLLLAVDSGAAKALGVIATIGLELLMVLIIVVAAVALGLLGQFWSREIAIADRSVGEALVLGYAAVRSRLRDSALTWLLMFGLGLAYGLVTVVLFFVVAAFGLAAGLGVGLPLYAATQSVVWAVVLGLLPFLVIVAVPLIFVQGLWRTFESSAWTLAYREITGRKAEVT